MRQVIVILIVLSVFDSVGASIVDQQGETSGISQLIVCSDLQFVRTFTADKSGIAAWTYMPEAGLTQTLNLPINWLPVESDYNEGASFRMRMVPELQGAILMYFGGLFVLRNRKSSRIFTS